MPNRRQLLIGLAGSCAAVVAAPEARAAPARADEIDAGEFGLRPSRLDQSRRFTRLLAAAAERNVPVYLPAGDYVVSGIELPPRVSLRGTAGSTRIVYGGGGHLFRARDGERIELSGLVLDGASMPLDASVRAILDLRDIGHLVVDDCALVASAANGIAIERVGGRIERSTISGADDCGLYSIDATGLAITGNTVTDCGNGGILVHRWQPGEDGTIVAGNRIRRIAARDGGTGQHGNGINVFRADAVMISGNHVSDCAFSAIRSNSGSNVQITGNTCLRSGETGIYSEFAFEGALISGNIVDGAANGISIVNFNEGGRIAVCSGNVVRNLSRSGPYVTDPPGFGVGISAEAETAITGNVVEGAPLYGINLGWGPFLRNVTATGNVIRGAGTGIAVTVAEGAGPAIIADNVISDTRDGAIVGHRWTEIATGDLARDGAAAFPHLTIARNHVG